MEVLVFIAIFFVVVWVIQKYLKEQRIKRRREALFIKYRDHEIVDRIMARSIWQNQTAGQLQDSLGRPVDIDERVMKSKTRETWKYNQQGKGRFGLRVVLENDLVVGWDQKN